MDALQTYLDTVRTTPFQWGEHDCAMFVAKAVDAMRGTRWANRVRGLGCRSARDYRAMLRDGATMRALTVAELGEPVNEEIERGDVLLLRNHGRQLLAIAAPPVALAVSTADGVTALPLTDVLATWRIR